jgi:hypothetical protein
VDRHSEIEEIASLFSDRLREAEQRAMAARQVMLDAIQTRLDVPPSDSALVTGTTLAQPTTSAVPSSPGTGTWRTPRDADLRWAGTGVVDGKTATESRAQWSNPADDLLLPARPVAQAASRAEKDHRDQGSDRAFLWAVPLAGLVALATVSLLLLLL